MALSDLVAINIRILRRRRRFTQKTLAKKSGLSLSYIAMLERNERKPPLETVETLAKTFGVPLSKMLK